jgi:thioredoxin reductase (NADPH)
VKTGDRFDVIIAGGGAAGLSCAIFLARGGLRVAVFDRAESSLRRVEQVNNYPGFAEGIGGADLLERASRQAKRFGVELIHRDVEKVARDAGGFAVGAGDLELACTYFVLASNKRTDLALALGLTLGGRGNRFVMTDPQGRTAVDGCYATGRITGAPSQAVVSAGHGALVAIGIIERVRGGYYVDHDT